MVCFVYKISTYWWFDMVTWTILFDWNVVAFRFLGFAWMMDSEIEVEEGLVLVFIYELRELYDDVYKSE